MRKFWTRQAVFLSELQARLLSVLLSSLRVTLLHADIRSDNTAFSAASCRQCLQKEHTFLQYSRCWVNDLPFLLKRNFYKPQGPMSIIIEQNLLSLERLRGADLQARVWPPLSWDDTAPQRAGRCRAPLFSNLPKAKTSGGESRFGFNVMNCWLHNTTSYHFLTLKE